MVRTSLSGAEAVAYALADNRTGELSEWDSGKLLEVLSGLADLDDDVVGGGDLLESSGFDDDFLSRMKDLAFADSLRTDQDVETGSGGPEGEGLPPDPYAEDEERGIERVAAPLRMELVLSEEDEDVVSSAFERYRRDVDENASRDAAIIGILRAYAARKVI